MIKTSEAFREAMLQKLGQQMTELELLLLTHINQTEKEETV